MWLFWAGNVVKIGFFLRVCEGFREERFWRMVKGCVFCLILFFL